MDHFVCFINLLSGVVSLSFGSNSKCVCVCFVFFNDLLYKIWAKKKARTAPNWQLTAPHFLTLQENLYKSVFNPWPIIIYGSKHKMTQLIH